MWSKQRKKAPKEKETGQLDLFGAQSMIEERDPEETAKFKNHCYKKKQSTIWLMMKNRSKN